VTARRAPGDAAGAADAEHGAARASRRACAQYRWAVAKDRFAVDLERSTVTCPAGQTAVIVPVRRDGGRASFRPWCATCPMLAE
jgi:hypothetical protein